MAVFSDAWDMTQAYPRGTKATYSGIEYETLRDVAANTSTTPDESTDWKAVSVARIFNHLSLTEAVRLYMNQPKNDMLNGSVPQFIQFAEQELYQKVHPPVQRQFIDLTVALDSDMDDMPYVTLPSNLEEFIHVRQKVSPSGASASSIEIVEADTSRFYQTAATSTRGSVTGEGLGTGAVFIEPVYLYNNERMYFAGIELAAGDTIQVFCELAVPQLGTTITINSTPRIVESNWYTTYAPRALLYGALLHAESYLKDDGRIQLWKQLYDEAIEELMQYIERFESSDKTAQYMGAEDYF